MRSRRIAFALALSAAAAAPAAAQDSAFVEIDRIAAVVGSVPISLSRVLEELNLLFAEFNRTGRPIPTDPDEINVLRREMLDRLIQDELLVQQALRDTIVSVTPQQVQTAAETAIRQTRSQFASELEYRRQLQLAGLGTPDEYRRYITAQTRRELLKQNLIESLRQRGDLRQIPPNEEELRAYFEQTRAQQPRRPATVTFRQIVIRPVPTPAADSTSRARADSVARALRNGADFATAARRFSDDVATREQGGELGWFRRGQMVREFEAIAFRLRPGQISNPVRSPFGYHVIEVERIEPAEIRARHVLFSPEITDADRAVAKSLADSVAALLRAGAPIDSLSREHHDPIEQSLFEGVVAEELFPSYRAALTDAEPGSVLGPVEVTENGLPRYAVLLFVEALPEGEYTFEELRDRLRAALSEGSGVRRLVEELRKATYVEIKI